MSENDEQVSEAGVLSTRAYLHLVFLNPISATGIVLTVAGIALISLSGPEGVLRGPLPAAGLMLFGIVVFALGYTRTQHVIKKQEAPADEREK